MSAIELVSFSNGETHVQEQALSQVLLNPKAANRPLIVISVVGAYRRGKSFLLNFILRYLKTGGKENWMGDDNDDLEGFTWSYGNERVTTGIYVWSEVFVINGVAVLLIDTQGTQDNQTDLKENSAIMAVSALLSSVQIVNLSERFESQDLMNLEFFSSYGKLIQDDSVKIENLEQVKIFQKLMFLIRDWKFVDKFSCGFEGGQKYLQDFIAPEKGQVNKDFQSVQELLHTCFQEVQCFLLPHPGDEVSDCRQFRGKLGDIAEDFKTELKVLIEALFEPCNVMVKRVAGQVVTGQQFMKHVQSYVKTINAGVVPDPKTMFNILADEVASDLVTQSKKIYVENMQKSAQTSDQNELRKLHENCRSLALQHFNGGHKLGAESHVEIFKKILCDQIEEEFRRIEERAESRRKFDQIKKQMDEEIIERKRLENLVESLQSLITEKSEEIKKQALHISNVEQKLGDLTIKSREYENAKLEMQQQIKDANKQISDMKKQSERMEEEIKEGSELIAQLEQKVADGKSCCSPK